MWNNPAVRAILYQVLVLGAVIGGGAYLISNTLQNLEQRSIRTGFEFLWREAGFDIGESMIFYEPSQTYFRALLVGLLNTLKVGFLGIVFASIIGVFVGIGRLSRNWLIAKLASVYVETIRNIPLLLQLFFWYAILTGVLPIAAESWTLIPNVYLANSGLNYPVPVPHPAHPYMLLAGLVGLVAAWIYARRARLRQDRTGQIAARFWPGVGFVVGLPFLVWLTGGMPTEMDVPTWQRFNFAGGHHLSPEFVALFLGLTIYTGGFIAETVRGGLLAVSHGQTEAARSLGLRSGQVLRLVVLPQALRVIVPPLTSQYLNLIKNSSLAVGIGYPDLVSVADTTLNQTGQAIEAACIMMAVYLAISLLISAFMNWYNKRVALVER